MRWIHFISRNKIFLTRRLDHILPRIRNVPRSRPLFYSVVNLVPRPLPPALLLGGHDRRDSERLKNGVDMAESILLPMGTAHTFATVWSVSMA